MALKANTFARVKIMVQVEKAHRGIHALGSGGIVGRIIVRRVVDKDAQRPTSKSSASSTV
jgi:hypothetical protein